MFWSLVISCSIGILSAAPVPEDSPIPKPKSYSGYQLWRIQATTDEQLQYLEHLWVNETQMSLDFWKPPKRAAPTEILVPPKVSQILNLELVRRDMHPEPIILNLQEALEKKDASSKFHKSLRYDDSSNRGLLDVSTYHTYDEIQNYLRALQTRFPQLVTVIKLGTTHEGRSIDAIKIANAATGPAQKKAFWLDSGIHAREWIAPAVSLYAINQLVEKYDSNPKSKELVDNMIWYILPVVNPDGYEYSRLYDRMWRKNRNPNGRQFSESCKGVDLNRNFDFFWTGKGSSSNPCKEIFRGESPFSEPETVAVRDFVLQHSSEIEAFITLHSYSQIWMYPYGHDYNNYPPDVDDLRSVALRATQKLQSFYGTTYIVDTGANALYPASGGSDDWSKGKVGIKYVYLIELRPNDYSVYGFLLPENQIVPVGKETWAGLTVVADEIMRKSGVTPLSPEAAIERPAVAATTSAPDCQDREGNYCRWWSSLGACVAWRQQMITSCAKSCNFCHLQQPPSTVG